MVIAPQPYPEALARAAGKTAVASQLSSAQWAEMPQALQDRAFLSARVDDLRVVSEMQARIEEALSFDPAGERAFMDRSKFVSEMREILGAPQGDSGLLTDISSRRRLELVYDWQKQDAVEYARWNASQDPDLLDSFPAQELLRVEAREEERDWTARWKNAGGPDLVGGRMVALKSHPVWTAISRFGRPWPPFDFGSGMGVEDIPREEAEQLGLIRPGEAPVSQRESFNAALAASLPPATPALLEAFQELFGSSVAVVDGLIQWKGGSRA